jgi:hypothetical protein
VVFLFRFKKKRSTHQDQVSIIVITEEGSREANTMTSVLFFYPEDRIIEAHTTRPVFFFYSELRRREAHIRLK